MLKSNVAKGVASVAAIAALAAGGLAVSSSGSSNAASAAGSAAVPATTGTPPTGAPRAGGRMFGTPVTGRAATKAKAAALAKYPGTAERVMKTPDGGYGVHVIKSDGTEVHVLESTTFKVTGTQTGGPPGGMVPPGSSGSPSSTGASTS